MLNILTCPIRVAMVAIFPIALPIEYIVKGHGFPYDWMYLSASFLEIEEI